MSGSSSIELIFIASPGIGHLVSTVEIARRMISRSDHIQVTVLIMILPFDSTVKAYAQTLAASNIERIRFIQVVGNEDESSEFVASKNYLSLFIESQKPFVKKIAVELVKNRCVGDPKLGGFVVDMFCTAMIDVAAELGFPSYVYFTSSASFLGLMLHLQRLRDEEDVDVTQYGDYLEGAVFKLSRFHHPIPATVLPSVVLDKDGASKLFLDHAKRFRKAKGILVNTMMELESFAIDSLVLDNQSPQIYPVGPILNLQNDTNNNHDYSNAKESEILMWLDQHPPCSVVFLCFGSLGSFGPEQVQEIARGLEASGNRFLWSLRRPPPKDEVAFPTEYDNPEVVLPDGFLTRTSKVGKIIGWAPQVSVLAHPAIGGFVSHCGWNSILESLWFGVPLATWPLYAEQQVNAFEVVRELGIAVEISLDYRKDFRMQTKKLVSAEEIERGIKCLMEEDSGVRRKMRTMKETSRAAMMKGGGSSYTWLGRFIHDMMDSAP
uniref:Glycosyltransferase n=1 Tax=Kalanchoe fedtschenkoi TaxID=63787 RepID=A0A7N0TFC8_KALFE